MSEKAIGASVTHARVAVDGNKCAFTVGRSGHFVPRLAVFFDHGDLFARFRINNA